MHCWQLKRVAAFQISSCSIFDHYSTCHTLHANLIIHYAEPFSRELSMTSVSRSGPDDLIAIAICILLYLIIATLVSVTTCILNHACEVSMLQALRRICDGIGASCRLTIWY